MRSTGQAWSYKAWCSAVSSCFSTVLIGAFRSLLFTQWFAPLAVRCRTALLLLCFFYHGQPHFWNFYSTIPVDVVRVKSGMNCLFDPAHVVIRVTINKLNFVLEWLVSSVVGMLLHSVLHRSSSLSNVHLATFTGNPVNYAILFFNKSQQSIMLHKITHDQLTSSPEED